MRRIAPVAVVLGVLIAAGMLWMRRGESVSPARAQPEVERTATRALRPLLQQLMVRLEISPDASTREDAPQGAFEGRVASARTGKGLADVQLVFAHQGQVTSVPGQSDGTFRFQPHAAGAWTLAAATAPGHLPFAPEWGQSPVQMEAQPHQVIRGIVISLAPADELQGRVLDPGGNPVVGADVRVLGGGMGSNVLVPIKDHFTSDDSGAFSFVAPEDAIVEATHSGFAAGRARVDYAVRLRHQLSVTLTPAVDGGLMIDGVVVDPEGAPAEGAVVSAEPAAKWSGLPVTAQTNVEGRFKLSDLEQGAWRLWASRPGAAAATLNVPAGSSGVRLQLLRGGALRGHVRDKATGKPLPSFTVLVEAEESKSCSVIAPLGEYKFDDLKPGPAVVSAVALGHAPSTQARVVIPQPGAGPAVADFELGAGGSLTGVVVEKGTGTPLSGAEVEVEGGNQTALGASLRDLAITDSSGAFTLTGLAEHPTGVQASASGHNARIISVPAIREGEVNGPVRIELSRLAPGQDAGFELAGIGAALQKQGEVLLVTKVMPGSGAAEVGLAPGDQVTSIDGQSVKPMTLMDAVPLLRGPEGTSVTLTVSKGGSPQAATTLVVPRRIVQG